MLKGWVFAFFASASIGLMAATGDSTINFKTSLYVSTRPVQDALLNPNIQIGFRTTDLNNKPKNNYLQLCFNYSSFAKLNYRRPEYSTLRQAENVQHYVVEADYRFLIKRNKFWSPHVEFSYYSFLLTNWWMPPYSIKGISVNCGFQNGKFYHHPDKSVFNSLYWGLGAQYTKDLKNLSSYSDYSFAMMIYLNWQFGFKSIK